MKKIIIVFSSLVLLLILAILGLVYFDNYSKETPISCGESITDFEGNLYNTISIGNRCWLKENLKSRTDSSGKKIDRYCYNNDEKNCDIYGGLYRWETIENKPENYGGFQGICPNGWHIPYSGEFEELLNSIPNKNYSDLLSGGNSGFNSILGGYGGGIKAYFEKEDTSRYWSSTNVIERPVFLNISKKNNVVEAGIYRLPKLYLLSVRCLKNYESGLINALLDRPN